LGTGLLCLGTIAAQGSEGVEEPAAAPFALIARTVKVADTRPDRPQDPRRAVPQCKSRGGELLIDFEGISDNEPVGDAYAHCGVYFGASAIGVVDEDYCEPFWPFCGSGNFANEPSPNTTITWLDASADALTMNVPGGMTAGFSFFYSAIGLKGFIRVYSGLNRTGQVLAHLDLPITPRLGAGDPTGDYDNWQRIGVTFSGVARSVDFGGTANKIGFDNITIGSPVPTDTLPARLEFERIPDQTTDTTFRIKARAVDVYGNPVRSFDSIPALIFTSSGNRIRPSNGTFREGVLRQEVKLPLPTPTEKIRVVAAHLNGESNPFGVTSPRQALGNLRIFARQHEPGVGNSPAYPGTVLLYHADGTLYTRQPVRQDGWVYLLALPVPTKGHYQAVLEVGQYRSPPAEMPLLAGSTVEYTLIVNLKPSERRPVMIVPGILGSTLRSDIGSLAPFLTRSIVPMDQLRILAPNVRVRILGKEIFWFDPVGYNHLKEDLEENFPVHPVPYDWRLPIDVIARDYLKPAIDQAKRSTNQPKVNIVAHSMGGLVARAYIQSPRAGTEECVESPNGLCYENDVERLVMLGSPNYGASVIYFMWEGGEPVRADLAIPTWRKSLSDFAIDRLLDVIDIDFAYTRVTDSLFFQSNGYHAFDFQLVEAALARVNPKLGLVADVVPDRPLRFVPPSKILDFYHDQVPSLGHLMPQYPFLSLPSGERFGLSNEFLDNLNAQTSIESALAKLNATDPGRTATLSLYGPDKPTLHAIHVSEPDPGHDIYVHGEPVKNILANGDGTVLSPEHLQERALQPVVTEIILPGSGAHIGLMGTLRRCIRDYLLTNTFHCDLSAAEKAPEPSAGLAEHPAQTDADTGNILEIQIRGYVQPLIADPGGRSLGVDPTTRTPREEIPQATVVLGRGHSSLTLPNPAPGSYTMFLQGPLEETFSIQATWRGADVDERAQWMGVYSGQGVFPVRLSLRPGAEPELELDPKSAPLLEVSTRSNGDQLELCWEPSGAEKYRVYGRPAGDLDLSPLGETSLNCYSPGHPFLLGDEEGEEWLYGVTALEGEYETLISALVSNRLHSVAEFTTSKTTGYAPLRVSFEDASIGLIDTWEWDLDGDGETDTTARNPSFIYQTPGLYSVRLAVSGPSGVDSIRKEGIVEVKQYIPPASSLRISPDPLLVCSPTDLPKVRVAWDAPPDLLVEIRIGSPTGTLFARSRGSGTRETGNWVSDGMQFYLIDVEAEQVLQHFRVALRRSCESRIWADPNPVEVCDGSSTASSAIFWEAPVEKRVEVRLGSPTGTLFATTWGSGKQATGKWVREGTTFVLWEPASRSELDRVTVHLQSDCFHARFWAEPNPAQVCDGSGLAKVKLFWEVPADLRVEIRVTSPSGPLFASTRGSGSRETGKWVKDGMTFVLVDPRTLKVAATLQVAHTQTGCNRAPVADAGPDLRVSPGARVLLDGSRSYDPDGDALAFVWTQLSTTSTGSVQIENPHSSRASFRAPDRTATLEFQLAVSDGRLTSQDSVVVFVGLSTTAGSFWSANSSGRRTEDGQLGDQAVLKPHKALDQRIVQGLGDLAFVKQPLVKDPIRVGQLQPERSQVRSQKVDPLLRVFWHVGVPPQLDSHPDNTVPRGIDADYPGIRLPRFRQGSSRNQPVGPLEAGCQARSVAGGNR
jgi:PKD repeat protein